MVVAVAGCPFAFAFVCSSWRLLCAAAILSFSLDAAWQRRAQFGRNQLHVGLELDNFGDEEMQQIWQGW